MRPLRPVQFKRAGHHHDRISVGKEISTRPTTTIDDRSAPSYDRTATLDRIAQNHSLWRRGAALKPQVLEPPDHRTWVGYWVGSRAATRGLFSLPQTQTMQTTQTYRRRAEDAERAADASRDAQAAQLLRAAAQRWRQLAEFAERRESERVPKSEIL